MRPDASVTPRDLPASIGISLPDDLLNVNEAAELAKAHPSTIRRWIAAGTLPAFRRAGRLFVSRRDVLAMFKRDVPDGAALPRTEAERVAEEAWIDKTLRDGKIRK